jgi:hypothetical protein
MTSKPQGQPTGTIDLLAGPSGSLTSKSLNLLTIGNDEIPFILFTSQAVPRDIHYGKEPEIKGYFLCNGEGCLYCLAGRKQERRLLIPVYSPTDKQVALLAVSSSERPRALLPQIRNILTSGKRVVVFASRGEDYSYKLSTYDIPEDGEAGAESITEFMADQPGNELVLPSTYQRLTNDQLADIPGVRSALQLKGIIR